MCLHNLGFVAYLLLVGILLKVGTYLGCKGSCYQKLLSAFYRELRFNRGPRISFLISWKLCDIRQVLGFFIILHETSLDTFAELHEIISLYSAVDSLSKSRGAHSNKLSLFLSVLFPEPPNSGGAVAPLAPLLSTPRLVFRITLRLTPGRDIFVQSLTCNKVAFYLFLFKKMF